MVIEVLFNEVCNLYGDGQNVTYLKAMLPQAEFVFTPLTDEPYFADNTPDMIYIGSMSESIQRKVIQKLLPLRGRLEELIAANVPILATGNAGEIFMKHIEYVTEKCEMDGLGILDFTVKTDLFARYNGKVLGTCDGIQMVGFRSQFSFVYGDNSDCFFVKCQRGVGINRDSKLEGVRRNNLICTSLLGPILPLNPLFAEYFAGLAGVSAQAAYKEAAMDAYNQRVREFSNPKVPFDH